MRFYNSYFLLAALGLSLVYSRPISYPEGITVMSQNHQNRQRLHIHYSPNIKRSLGLVLQHNNTPTSVQQKHIQGGLQWNELLYRRNTKNSQTNLYFKAIPLFTKWGGSLGIAGDSETRRFFGSYEWVQEYNMYEPRSTAHHFARVGVAPYVAEFNNLHLWFMLQAHQYMYSQRESATIVWTPLVRLFKGPVLAELGSNLQSTFLLNVIIRL
jgi:hypothetical protein